MGYHCVIAVTGIARELKTVAAKISLAFSSTPALVKQNVQPRSCQESGWTCPTKEQTGSNFGKVMWYNNWLTLNIFFAGRAVDSELGIENFVTVLKYLVSWYFHHCLGVVQWNCEKREELNDSILYLFSVWLAQKILLGFGLIPYSSF